MCDISIVQLQQQITQCGRYSHVCSNETKINRKPLYVSLVQPSGSLWKVLNVNLERIQFTGNQMKTSQLITASTENNRRVSKHLQQINCRDAKRKDNYVALDRSLVIILFKKKKRSHKNYRNNFIRPRNTHTCTDILQLISKMCGMS